MTNGRDTLPSSSVTDWKSEISRLRAQLAAREATISGLQTQITSRIGINRLEVANYLREINRLQSELIVRDGTISRLQSELSSREAAINHLSAHAKVLETNFNSVLHSRSWRITAPLRAFMKAIRSNSVAQR
jgi:hypothetical protein